MSEQEIRQRLAAILAADVAGYSRLMAADEHATVASLDAGRAVFRAQIDANRGRVIDMAGDSVLAVFETAAGAVSAALAVQQALGAASNDVPDERVITSYSIHYTKLYEHTRAKAPRRAAGGVASRLHLRGLPGSREKDQ